MAHRQNVQATSASYRSFRAIAPHSRRKTARAAPGTAVTPRTLHAAGDGAEGVREARGEGGSSNAALLIAQYVSIITLFGAITYGVVRLTGKRKAVAKRAFYRTDTCKVIQPICKAPVHVSGGSHGAWLTNEDCAAVSIRRKNTTALFRISRDNRFRCRPRTDTQTQPAARPPNLRSSGQGEVIVDTDKDTSVVQDGATPGGFPLASESAVVDGTFYFNDDVPITKIDIIQGIWEKMFPQ